MTPFQFGILNIIHILDTKTNKKKAGINIDEIMDVTQYACFSSSHQIILLGCKDEHQGIYTYDIDSGKTELLYESKNELINLITHNQQVNPINEINFTHKCQEN